ncbi:MFS transporter [Nonomuraea rubra]|uniref:MFS transporter n=1 Tax=Nonomuraea rubra TaxID=46180 RepID=UPI0031EA0CAC
MISTPWWAPRMPTIVGELGGQDQYSWVASATMLTMTVSTPLWGKLSDLFGRKLLFQSALGLFRRGDRLVAGLSQDMGQLIAARAVQGLGVARAVGLSQLILGDIVSPREQWPLLRLHGSRLRDLHGRGGPLLGGFIVDAGLAGLALVLLRGGAVRAGVLLRDPEVLKLPRVKRSTSIDIWGATTITASASALMLLLTLGRNEFEWNSGWTYFLGAVALLMLALAVLSERTARNPILPPRLFRNPTFVLTSLASLFVGMAMFGAMIYLPQYRRSYKGLSPTNSGLMTLPMVVALSWRRDLREDRHPDGQVEDLPGRGLLIVAIGLFLLSRLHVDSSEWLIGFDVAVLGVGLGLSMQMLILGPRRTAPSRRTWPRPPRVCPSSGRWARGGVAAFGAILTRPAQGRDPPRWSRRRASSCPAARTSKLGSPRRHPAPALARSRTSCWRRSPAAWRPCSWSGVPIALLGFLATLFLKELPLARVGGPAAPEAKPLGKDDLVLDGLLLELIAQRVERVNGEPSALLTARRQDGAALTTASERELGDDRSCRTLLRPHLRAL